jgi:hypothetical protein
MVKTFADQHIRLLFETSRSRCLPPEIVRRAVRNVGTVQLQPVALVAKADCFLFDVFRQP